jgi:hypothetical protein
LFGKRVEIDETGDISHAQLSADDRIGLLVDELGISEEMAMAVPPDLPTPPPTS